MSKLSALVFVGLYWPWGFCHSAPGRIAIETSLQTDGGEESSRGLLSASESDQDAASPKREASIRWPEALEWNAQVSTSAWSGNRRLDDLQGIGYAQVVGHLSYKWSEAVDLIAEGYIGREEAPGSEADHDHARLREAYLRFRGENLAFSLGPQIIAWGRADVINPTDNVSARDYTLLVDRDADQKIGLPTANLTYRRGNLTLQALVQGSFEADRIPLREVNGNRYVEHQPARDISSYGARVDWSGDAVSWSLSAMSGAMKRPNLRLDQRRVAEGLLDVNYPDAVIYGGDFEWLAGQWIVRGEAAYSDVEDSGTDPLSSRESSFIGVLEIERDFGGVSGFLETTFRRTYDYIDPSETTDPLLREAAIANAVVNEEARRTIAGIGAGLFWSTSDLLWEASSDLLYIPVSGELILRPRFRYRVNDSAVLWFGADYARGERSGLIGRLRDNSVIFLGISLSASAQ